MLNFFVCSFRALLRLHQTYSVELFAKIVKGFWLLAIFTKSHIVNVPLFFQTLIMFPLAGLHVSDEIRGLKQSACLLLLKGALSGQRQFLATKDPLKMMKNACYFTWKALFVLKIFKFLFWSCIETALLKR